jgi:hypothetical protein
MKSEKQLSGWMIDITRAVIWLIPGILTVGIFLLAGETGLSRMPVYLLVLGIVTVWLARWDARLICERKQFDAEKRRRVMDKKTISFILCQFLIVPFLTLMLAWSYCASIGNSFR